MRRLVVMMAGLVVALCVAGAGAAGNAGSVAGLHVKPGSVWTSEVNVGGCEVQTFAKGHTWTADSFGDAGTYSGGGKTITVTITAGDDSPSAFSGTYSKKGKDYTGSFSGSGAGLTGQLVKGAVSSWMGQTC